MSDRSVQPTKARALKMAATHQEALNRAEAKATEAAKVRDAAMDAARGLGATYAELQAATGLSVARVTQVLRRVREARTATD